MTDSIYQHFRPEEGDLIDTAMDWVQQVLQNYAPFLTQFLDPREQYIVQSIVGQYAEVKLSFEGGYEKAERKRAFLYPDYFMPAFEDYDLELVEVHYPTAFASLSHGQVMGSLLNIGLKREVFGDILVQDESIQFIMDKQLFPYVRNEVDKMGRVSVRLEEQDFANLVEPINDYEESRLSVSSMRLDAVISTALNISRQRAKDLIKAEKVKVNWATVARVDYELELLDQISVRGFGRLKIMEQTGISRKNKLQLRARLLDSRKKN